MPAKLLGIDVGTGGTRAVLIEGQGTVIASRTAEHPAFRVAANRLGGTGSARLVARHLRSHPAVMAASSTESDPRLRLSGFSGQMHGAVLLDSEGKSCVRR